MPIVDSQVHVWAAETPERPWSLDLGEPQRPVPFGPDDLLREMDASACSGAPTSRARRSYRRNITLFTEEMPWFSREDLEWIMGRGVCEWLGWRARLIA